MVIQARRLRLFYPKTLTQMKIHDFLKQQLREVKVKIRMCGDSLSAANHNKRNALLSEKANLELKIKNLK